MTEYHQGTAPHIDRKFAGTTLLAEIQFEQESFTEVLRHLCCAQVQAHRVSSYHHVATMEATVNPIRSGRSRYCEVHSHQQLNHFHYDVLWENVFLVRGADHDVQELGDVVCEFMQNGRQGLCSNVFASYCRST